jgi:hypothetical protein
MPLVASSSPCLHNNPLQALRPEIRKLIEALARDAVARENRRAQEGAGKDQAEEK